MKTPTPLFASEVIAAIDLHLEFDKFHLSLVHHLDVDADGNTILEKDNGWGTYPTLLFSGTTTECLKKAKELGAMK